MERVLLDSSTLMSAAGLLRGEQKPSAYNVVALATLVESVILHDSVLVLDTVDPLLPDSRLHAAAETYGAGAITTAWTTVDAVVEGYVSLENPEAYKTRQSMTELPYHESQYQQAVDETQENIQSTLYTQRYIDDELANYLDMFDIQIWRLYEAEQVEEEQVSPSDGENVPTLEEFARGLRLWGIEYAFDRFKERYTQFTPPSGTPWLDPEDPQDAMDARGPVSKDLLLRAHFYILASEVFAAPYRPDALRAPICVKYFGEGSSFEERMVVAADALSKTRIKHINDFMGRSDFAVLPFFLARVFHESRSPEDVIDVTRQLRASDEANRFREHLRHLRQAEEGEDIETIYREIKRYEALLRREFGEGERSIEVLWSIGASAGKAAALPTPAATADLVATTAKGLIGVPGALSRWWYGRKVALISKTLRQGRRARGIQVEIERLFGAKLDPSDIEFLDSLDEVMKTKNDGEHS